jgi:ADP-heptose:LPS heptosyltransferase
MAGMDQILVIKLGAFGDFIQALGPMAAIRRHHPNAHITLLTTPPFLTLARESGYFNDIWTDSRPSWIKLKEIGALRRRLQSGKFTRVYDLQNNDRTALYLWLTGLTQASRPEWVGAAFGASHRNNSPQRIAGHAFDGHQQTLALAGIQDVGIDRLEWVRADAGRFNLPHPYILLVPGSAPARPEKRWPATSYGELARHLYGWGYTPVVIGTLQEADLGKTIMEGCPHVINLCGQTAMTDLVALARDASCAIGNDTGPVHLIAPTGCPTIVLFSGHSDPLRHAPKGDNVRTIQNDNLNSLKVEEVLGQISARDFRHKGDSANSA